MASRVKIHTDDSEDVEGHASRVKFLNEDGSEVEGHGLRHGRTEDEAEVEGHGPIFRLTTDDPTVVTALAQAGGIEGPGEADLSQANARITLTQEDGTGVEGHAAHCRFRDAGDGTLEAEVEGHAFRHG